MTDVPRSPEHPRPTCVRPDWLTLNGQWEFEIDHGDTGLERGLLDRPLAGEITVPFAPESAASGIGDTDFLEAVWYARDIAVPAEWSGRRVLLHFGAVDHDATVWAEGVEVTRHRGGFSSFTADLGERAGRPSGSWCAPATAGTAYRPAASRPRGTPTPTATTRAPPGSGRACGWRRCRACTCAGCGSPRTSQQAR